MSPRRFSLAPFVFLALWALWLLLPATREAAKHQWQSRLATLPNPDPYHVAPPANDSSRDAAFIDALQKQGGGVSGGTNERGKALEELGRRFPNDASICAAQIVSTVSELHLAKTRYPGPSSSADPNWSVKLTEVQPSSPQFLKSWFAAAARGTKLEPNNTFWDWAQIMGLLAANRDDEVWPVLRAARNKTGYDDHANDGALARLRVGRQQQILSPIGQISIAASILFPHYATMREASRQISDHASGLRISGNAAKQKQSLEGLRDFAQMAGVMRRESKSFIGSLVGTAMESIALYGGSYSPLGPRIAPRRLSPGASVASYAKDPRSLLTEARRQGRNDIAAQISQQWVEMGKYRTKTRPAAITSTLIGLNMTDLVLAQVGEGVGVLLVGGIPTLLALALGCSSLLFLVPAWRREKEVPLSLISWGWGAFLSVSALLTLSSSVLYALWGASRVAGATPLDLLIAPFSSSTSSTDYAPLSWQYNFPALLGAVAALWLAVRWDERRQGLITLTSRLRALLSPPEDGMARFDLTPVLVLSSTLAAFFLMTVGVLCFLILPTVNSDFRSLHDYAVFCLIAFAVIMALPCVMRLRTPAGRAFALKLTGRFAWGQLIFLTLVWGILWMFASSAQSRFDADFTRQLQVGEFQLVRKQVGL